MSENKAINIVDSVLLKIEKGVGVTADDLSDLCVEDGVILSDVLLSTDDYRYFECQIVFNLKGRFFRVEYILCPSCFYGTKEFSVDTFEEVKPVEVTRTEYLPV